MVFEDFDKLMLGVDYSVVGYYILGVWRRKYVQQSRIVRVSTGWSSLLVSDS